MSLLNTFFKKRHEVPKDADTSPTKIIKTPTSSPTPPVSLNKIFHLSKLNDQEKTELRDLLKRYAQKQSKLELDLDYLIGITSEIKAINNQAIILHGERISRAQRILKSYKEGAFTAWLIATYGNRQTPYNFLQYFTFYKQLPQQLHSKFEKMPRQAVYALASRDGEMEKKVCLVKNFSGQSKQQLLREIRTIFPLSDQDKRKQRTQEHLVHSLEKICDQIKEEKNLNAKNKDKLKQIIQALHFIID